MPAEATRERDKSSVLRFEDIPFSAIPGQSKLFLDYLDDPRKLSEYYPSAVSTINELSTQVPAVLAGYTVDRASVCSMLEHQNLTFGSGAMTFENIEKLRSANCVAVLTGQQAGLLSGPLYTIYKALSAVIAAKTLSEMGTPAVPIFWIASEDHDFEEVAKTFTVAKKGNIFESAYTAPKKDTGKPIGEIAFDDSIEAIIGRMVDELPRTEFTVELRRILGESYQPGETFASAFAKMLSRLFSEYGLIIFDPMDTEAKQLASPIFCSAIENSASFVEAVIERSRKLESDGYHSQVLVEENYFPLFWFDESGIRRSLKKTANGMYRATDTKHEFTIDDLIRIAKESPQLLSPGVMLRPVVQDFLFPTICYFGGAAEIAYFAQNSEVYRILERHVTTILPRQSLTVVEAKIERTMKKYGFTFRDLFAGIDNLWPELVERMIDPETPRVFAEVEEKINVELNRLDRQLSKVDPTLAESLAKRKRKIVHHIGALRAKFQRVHIQKDEIINRQVKAMFDSLLPNGGLQERTLGTISFLNSYGPHLVDWICESVDLDNKDHRLLYL